MTSASWSFIPTLSDNGPPISGNEDSFFALATRHTELAENIEGLISSLRVTSEGGGSLTFEGEAAKAFDAMVQEVAAQIEKVPVVARSVAGIFSSHKDKLIDLQAEAAEALLRAQTRWNDHVEAKTALQSAKDAIAGQAEDLTHLENRVEDTGVLISLSILDWNSLKESESVLDKTTEEALRDQPLGDLADPKWWEKLGALVLKIALLTVPFDEIWRLAEALVNGDFADILWRLRDLLDQILIIGTMIFVVALLVTGSFIALPLFFVVVSFGKVLLDTYLYVEKIEDKSRGNRTVSGKDVVLGWTSIGLGFTPKLGGTRLAQSKLGSDVAFNEDVITGLADLTDTAISIGDPSVSALGNSLQEITKDDCVCEQIEGMENWEVEPQGDEKILIGAVG